MIENDIKQQLVTAGIETSGNVALGATPATPANVIVITTADSVLTSALNSITKQALIPPGISDIQQTITITVRNSDYASGQSKVWDVYNELVGNESGYKLVNNRKMFIQAVQPPHYASTDANNSTLFTFNFVANTSRDT